MEYRGVDYMYAVLLSEKDFDDLSDKEKWFLSEVWPYYQGLGVIDRHTYRWMANQVWGEDKVPMR